MVAPENSKAMVHKINIHKIQPYQRLASYYDRLMDYIDYDIWVEDIELLVQPFNPAKHWLDISCGTGSMAIKLAKRGLHMTAVDISSDMVDIAREKANLDQVHIDFAVGDMINYQSQQAYDVIINLHDGLNYLLDVTDIQLFMANAYSLLNPGGILLFDVVTPLLCQTHFRGYREIFHDENGGYERITNYDPISRLAESVFTLDTGEVDTVDVETHIQKAYEIEEVENFCASSDFEWWQILDDESLETGTSESERFMVLLRKNP